MINRKFNLLSCINDGRSVFLFGPRGVGKSQLIKTTLEQLKNSDRSQIMIDLLKTSEFKEFIKAPELLYQQVAHRIRDNKKLIVCIDEVQRVPAVLNEVHRALEDFKQQVQFILTGSSARKLKRSGANLLAGRAATYKLHPFTSEEIEIDLNTTLQFGSLPLVYSLKNPIPTLRSYIDTYLTQEIQQEAIVRQLEPFIRFIELAAQFNGQPINYSKIAKQVGVSTNTVIDYFSILVDTLIATRIEPWSYSVIRQLAASPRFYLFDCGVLNALSGELRTELRPSSGRYGNLFETFVVNEIIRANDYYELDNKFFYIRTHSGVEADLIISRGPRDTPRMIEIKSKNSPDEADLKQLFIAHALLPESKAYCICTTPRAYMLRDVTVLPWQTGIHTILENVHF